MKQVTSWPLAVCDSSTVKSHECHKVDTIFPHYASEIYHLGHGCDHKWYFLGEQKESEVLLMQVYDSNFPERRGTAPTLRPLNPNHLQFSRRLVNKKCLPYRMPSYVFRFRQCRGRSASKGQC
jgi:hypothetical protein